MSQPQAQIDLRSRSTRGPRGAAPVVCESLEERALLSSTITAAAVDTNTTTTIDPSVDAKATTDNGGGKLGIHFHGKFHRFP